MQIEVSTAPNWGCRPSHRSQVARYWQNLHSFLEDIRSYNRDVAACVNGNPALDSIDASLHHQTITAQELNEDPVLYTLVTLVACLVLVQLCFRAGKLQGWL